MKEKRLLYALGDVDAGFLDEAAPQADISTRRLGRRVTAVLAAAVLILLLTGVGVAAAVYGGSIQSLFGRRWEEKTGMAMSEGQAAVIDHLSQEIGLSQTVGGVTVTVDSAAVGSDNVWLLLRVEGVDFSGQHIYFFGSQELSHEPQPEGTDDGAAVIGGFGLNYLGVDGDGAALMLAEAESSAGAPLDIMLELKDLTRYRPDLTEETVVAEGTWDFVFSLDGSSVPAPVSLPDTEVLARNLETGEDVPVRLYGIELSATGLRYRFDTQRGTLDVTRPIRVVLKNGLAVDCETSFGGVQEDGTTIGYTCQWEIPVDPDEVAAVQIGEVEIPVP